MKELKSMLSPWLHESTVERLLIILIATLLVFFILFLSKRAIGKHITDSSKKYRARRVINIFAYVLILIVWLFVYSDKLGNIGVTMGLAAAGIAFALSEVITGFAGWVSIMFTNQVKVGDRVKIGDLKGDIIDIKILKITIMEVGDWVNGDLYNGRITSISNSFVFKQPIQSYSADYPFLWDELEVPLRVNSDFKLAKKIFEDITQEICGEYSIKSKKVWDKMQDKFSVENAQVEPMITMRFDQNWITFTIRYVVDYRRRRKTKDLLFTRLLEEINKQENNLMLATAAMEVTTISKEV